MKKLLLLFSLISLNAFATDRGVPCNSNSCKVKIVTKDSGGVDVTGLSVDGTGKIEASTSATDTFISNQSSGYNKSILRAQSAVPGFIRIIDTDDNTNWATGVFQNQYWGFWNTTGTSNQDLSGGAPKFRINLNGSILSGTIAAPAHNSTFYGQPGIIVNNVSTAASPRDAIVFQDNAEEVNGRIECTATSNSCSYTTSSDLRLKTNFSDFSGIEIVQKMKPLVYERKTMLGVKEYGFVAQDLYKVLPQAASRGGEDPNKEPWGVDYGKVTAVLTKAIQEQQKQIEELKNKLAKIKGQ